MSETGVTVLRSPCGTPLSRIRIGVRRFWIGFRIGIRVRARILVLIIVCVRSPHGVAWVSAHLLINEVRWAWQVTVGVWI